MFWAARTSPQRGVSMIWFIALVLLLGLPATAHAYIDPGSGSFVLQMVVAAVLGAGVTLKMYWKRIFGRGNKPEEVDDLDD